MILGNICTRACSFCAVQTGKPTELDLAEPPRVAEAVAKMGLKHCVITSVARDDLPDGGAKVWANTIRAVRNKNPNTAIEVLVPDFKGQFENLDIVLEAKPDIFNHNLETVERLQRPIRKTASYQRSLDVLSYAKKAGFPIKSGIMLGLGEEEEEIRQALQDLASIQLDVLTLGQYLQPSDKYAPIKRWATPEEFANWKTEALEMGITVVESGPLVRSSYHADEQSDRFTAEKKATLPAQKN
jgi:lipoic acid synthetase